MTRIISFSETSDPDSVANQAVLYAKDVDGVTKLFVRQSDGSSVEVGAGSSSMYALPEQWTATEVPVSATNETMSAQVDTGDDAVAMIRSGNVTGLVVKLSEARTAGTVTVAVTINGAVGTLQLTVSDSSTVAWASQSATNDAFVAGDKIGLVYSTSGTLDPADTINLEAWIQVTEAGVVAPVLTRSINTTAPLTGGGDLSADRTLGVNTFTDIESGVVPASGGGMEKFLRADGLWAVPGQFSGVSAYRAGANITINNAQWSVITYDTENFDTNGYFDVATNPTRFYVPAAGYYHMTAGIQFVNNGSGGNRGVGIAKNQAGSTTPTDSSLLRIAFYAPGSFDLFLPVSVTAYLAAGDYVEVMAYQGSGGSLSANAPTYSPFTMYRVG